MKIDIDAVDHLLTTTRGVRKRIDWDRPVEPEVIEKCIGISMQSPVGSLAQKRHFIVVTDPEKRRQVGDVYRKACYPYLEERKKLAAGLQDESEAKLISQNLVLAEYQADRMHDHPVLFILALDGRVENDEPSIQAGFYGSILPAAWSLMLALRSRGIGSCWTTLHLVHEADAVEALGIPEDITQVALISAGYYTGEDFKPAKRLPAKEQIHWDRWGRHEP